VVLEEGRKIALIKGIETIFVAGQCSSLPKQAFSLGQSLPLGETGHYCACQKSPEISLRTSSKDNLTAGGQVVHEKA